MQDDDPLQAWRRSAHPQQTSETSGKEPYRAFDGPHDRPHSYLHVCPASDAAWEWLPYAGIERIVHDGPHGTRLGLIWGFAVVVIEGRNLQKLDRHFANQAIAEVCAFDADRFHDAANTNAPFIERIAIHTESRTERLDAETQLIDAIRRRH